MKRIILLSLISLLSFDIIAQEFNNDSIQLRDIYTEALENGEAYENLRFLCKEIGPRLSGSENAQKAVEWSYQKMKSYGFDKVWLQEVMVTHWERGSVEKCSLLNDKDEKFDLSITALGGSISTDREIIAEVIEVASLDDLKSRSDEEIKDKIVFINQPMDQSLIQTFHAYGACAGIRVWGASEAAKKGAVAVINRSLSSNDDDHPHTGVMAYKDSIPRIPAAAISVHSAEVLHQSIINQQKRLALELSCQMYPDAKSYNVIAEIKGSEKPDEVIVVGGHLDSWDIGEGAHDDGAGVMQSLEVLRLFKELNIKPKRTIRCVLFMNEENGNKGGKGYAKAAIESGEIHFMAMESDRGGFTPRGFSIDGSKEQVKAIQEFSPLFESYFSDLIVPGYGGVDINPLKPSGTVLIGLVPDSQRYFDVHHSANDVFESVNKRELHLGAAGMASLIYLIDKYGLPMAIKD
jgi:carboxypeptidase Q